MKPVKYTYGLTTALLLGGATLSLATGYPAGAQVAQNAAGEMARVVPRPGAPSSFADLTDQLAPAVVNISTRQRVQVANSNPFAGTPFADLFGNRGNSGPQTREAQSLGSGFIISADGVVVTNNHVVQPGNRAELESITVTMPDGTEYPARLVGRDAASDLAVLKIESNTRFPFVKFGDSSQARVGDWVIAIGNPFGLGGTVTSGIVSAVLRNTGGGAYDRYIQTDASINRGNSGGPLFDMQGNVIGINNAIFSPTGGSVGIGFAIPAEVAAPIVEKLRQGEAIERGYLGVQIQSLNEDLASSLGIGRNTGEFVQAVEPGGAADRAGIQAGDVVVRVNRQEVTRDQTLSYLVANTAPGTRIPIELIREGRRLTVTATVAQRPSEDELREQSFDPDQEQGEDEFSRTPEAQGDGLTEEALGLSLIELTPRIARQLGARDDTQGLVINVVDPNSDAAAKGLRRGDILLSANYRSVTSVEDVENAIRNAQRSNRDALLLRVQRRGQPATYIPVRMR